MHSSMRSRVALSMAVMGMALGAPRVIEINEPQRTITVEFTSKDDYKKKTYYPPRKTRGGKIQKW